MSDLNGKMSFGDHLEELRQMLLRILSVVCVVAVVVFCLKDITWSILLAPSKWDFCTYRWIETVIHHLGISDFRFEAFEVQLITTELSSQFMTHITTACYLGLLAASPFVVYELFRFISPALYDNEKKYSVRIAIIIYLLFILGVLVTYFILFPISFRFLSTYSVAESIRPAITLDSYVETLTTLTLLMGVVFQLPVVAYILGKMGVINSRMLAKYRKHSFIIIMIVAAIITPPDLMTLILVTIPLYLLYEASIRVVKD